MFETGMPSWLGRFGRNVIWPNCLKAGLERKTVEEEEEDDEADVDDEDAAEKVAASRRGCA